MGEVVAELGVVEGQKDSLECWASLSPMTLVGYDLMAKPDGLKKNKTRGM